MVRGMLRVITGKMMIMKCPFKKGKVDNFGKYSFGIHILLSS